MPPQARLDDQSTGVHARGCRESAHLLGPSPIVHGWPPTSSIDSFGELRRRKAQHEDEVAHLTGLVFDRRSTVLRVFGQVKDAAMVLD